MDCTLTNGSFNFLVDSQQLKYQKDKYFAHVEKHSTYAKFNCLSGISIVVSPIAEIGQTLKVDTNMSCHTCLKSWTCPQYDVLI